MTSCFSVNFRQLNALWNRRNMEKEFQFIEFEVLNKVGEGGKKRND